MIIEKDKVVLVNYQLKNKEGVLLSATGEEGPLGYIHGIGMMIPGFESALDGKSSGEQLEFTVSPTDGYGDRDDQLVQSMPKSNFDNTEHLEVGAQFEITAPDGVALATILSIDEDTVQFDLNHPLAGIVLHFSVEVKLVRDATSDELAKGYVQGADDTA